VSRRAAPSTPSRRAHLDHRQPGQKAHAALGGAQADERAQGQVGNEGEGHAAGERKRQPLREGVPDHQRDAEGQQGEHRLGDLPDVVPHHQARQHAAVGGVLAQQRGLGHLARLEGDDEVHDRPEAVD
jgi:hypothetical protein